MLKLRAKVTLYVVDTGGVLTHSHLKTEKVRKHHKTISNQRRLVMNLEQYRLTGDKMLATLRELRNEQIRYTPEPVTRAQEDEALCNAQLEELKPAIEEAEKEERERIFNKIEEMNPMFEYLHGVILTPSQYQTLKEGK